MRRRIVFEIEAEGTENIIDSITKIIMDKVNLNCEFGISQEIVPERKRYRFLHSFRTDA